LLNAFMKQNKLSRTAAAKKLRYARPSISRWATGVRDPRDKTFARLEKRIVAYRQLQLDL
jgi:transcriptional regulator with XRE-family HTH domain